MRRHISIICMVVGLLAWLGLGMKFAFAQSGVIYPVQNAYPYTPIPSSQAPIMISLVDPSGANLTSSWLPQPTQPYNQVRIQVKNAAGQVITPTSISLMLAVPNPIISKQFATSAYPGECTNSGTSTTPDFQLAGDLLTSLDNGGMAAVVVTVGNDEYKFIIPQDTNFDGIPDNYELKYGFAVGTLARDADIDTGPDPASPMGDGIANIDEYRGFKVANQYVRGDPTKKDLFVHLEGTLQCTATAGTFTGQTNLVSLATFFPGPNGLGDPYANVKTLPNVRVNYINNDEWINNFSSYDVNNLVILSGTDQTASATTDRWININSIASNPKPVKGVRIIQCLDLSTLSPLGRADKHPPDLTNKDNGNAVLFVHRIVKATLNLITGPTLIQPIAYYTFENGKWVLKETIGTPATPSNPSVSDVKVARLMQVALAWYLAHEAFEHSFDVTATEEITRRASYGYHHADGSGTNVDIKITNTLTNSANKFYIPKYFGIRDQQDMRVLSSQP